jgi:hypothetical protein
MASVDRPSSAEVSKAVLPAADHPAPSPDLAQPMPQPSAPTPDLAPPDSRQPSAPLADPASANVQPLSRSARLGRWLRYDLLVGAVILTAVTSAVTAVVTHAVDPNPDEILARFGPAQDARNRFESDLKAVAQTKGGLQSELYAMVMRERADIDDAYGTRRYEEAATGYARLTHKITESCHGRHPTMTPIPGICARPTSTTPYGPAYPQTAGGIANTWTNYATAGGVQGPMIPFGTTVQVACKVNGFRVADGNTWWYRIASPPWNGAFYVSADAFYNNGQTSGSLHGTPFVDQGIPDC